MSTCQPGLCLLQIPKYHSAAALSGCRDKLGVDSFDRGSAPLAASQTLLSDPPQEEAGDNRGRCFLWSKGSLITSEKEVVGMLWMFGGKRQVPVQETTQLGKMCSPSRKWWSRRQQWRVQAEWPSWAATAGSCQNLLRLCLVIYSKEIHETLREQKSRSLARVRTLLSPSSLS